MEHLLAALCRPPEVAGYRACRKWPCNGGDTHLIPLPSSVRCVCWLPPSQIFVGGKLVGGASELLPLLEDGSFQQLLAEAHGDPLPAAVREALPAQVGATALILCARPGELSWEEGRGTPGLSGTAGCCRLAVLICGVAEYD